MNVRDEEFSIHYNSGEFEKTHVEPIDKESLELATAAPVDNSLVLYYLQVPEPSQGIVFEKLGLALFYYILNISNYNNYAIKFGGWEKRTLASSSPSDFKVIIFNCLKTQILSETLLLLVNSVALAKDHIIGGLPRSD